MVELIQHMTSLIPGDVVLGGAALIVEAILRMIPSQKPLSILYLVADSAKALGDFFGKAGDALNHVLPQRLAAPQA